MRNILFFGRKNEKKKKRQGREKLVSFSPMAFAYTCSQVVRGVLKFSENINRATHKDINGEMKEK